MLRTAMFLSLTAISGCSGILKQPEITHLPNNSWLVYVGSQLLPVNDRVYNRMKYHGLLEAERRGCSKIREVGTGGYRWNEARVYQCASSGIDVQQQLAVLRANPRK